MDNTISIIGKFIGMLCQGRIAPEMVPIEDIKACVELEIKVNHNTFLEKQYDQVRESFLGFSRYISDGEKDSEKVLMFLEGMRICINTISLAVRSLANRDYWIYKHREETDQPEIMEIIDYVDRKHDVRLLNYDFTEKYESMEVEVKSDPESGMIYIPFMDRKMFFPFGWQYGQAADYFRNVIAEQDAMSPHSYQKDGYNVRKGDVIVDAGAAEGIFALMHIEEASHIFLLDADEGWINALEKTFEKEKEKVTIVKGYVGERQDNQGAVTIDGVCGSGKVDYIKMDIEGHEIEALRGAKNVLQNNEDLRCAICAYHEKNDEKEINTLLNTYGYQTDHSRGYICPDWTVEARLDAELRRGIIFGRRN